MRAINWVLGYKGKVLLTKNIQVNMAFYLIENMMGFERPVEVGSLADLELKKRKYERNPAARKMGSEPNKFVIKATYYIVPKEDWDIHSCPLIPVDLS